MELAFQSFEWTLIGGTGESWRHPHLELDARLKLPMTLTFANGTEVSQDFYLAVHPEMDPEIKLSGGGLDIDLGKCPWYAGLTAPPKDLKVDSGQQDQETQARKGFLSKVLQGAGDEIRDTLTRLLQLPGELFEKLRAQVTKFLHDHVFGAFTRWLDIEDTVTKRIDSLLRAVENLVRDAMGWLMSLARDVAKWLITTADQIATLTLAGCRSLVDAIQALYHGVLDGAKQMAEVIGEALVTMAKDVARFAEQIKATIISLVQEALIAAREFAEDVERHLAWALTQLVKAYGMAEAKVKAFFQTVAEGIATAANKVGVAARDACNFFVRLVEAAAHGLHKIADDASVLYVWIGKIVRWGLEAFVKAAKVANEWLCWGAHAMGRGARALSALVSDFAEKSAKAVEPYAKAVLEGLAALAKVFGQVARKAFADFLKWVAGWSRTLFHAVCKVLHETEEILIAIIGHDYLADVKEALGFLCDFLEAAGDAVNRGIDALYHFGRYVAVELPGDIANVGAVIQKQIDGLASSIGKSLEKAFKLLVLQVGNHVKNDPMVQAVSTIIKAIHKFGEMAGVWIADKTLAAEAGLRDRIENALKGLDDTCQSLVALLEGSGEGSVIEARFRSLSMAPPRGSKRSQAKVDVLSKMPIVHKITGDDVLVPALQALSGEIGIEIGALELFGYNDWRFSAPHPVRGEIDIAPDDAVKARFLPVPIAPKHDVVFRLCINPRMWVIDPRYSWGYGASNQMRLADIDGDGKVDEWEVRRSAQAQRDKIKTDPDADPFTAEDLQNMLDQVENVLHGVPYRQIGAPFGLLAGYEGGSWLWFSVASIGDEDVGNGASMPQGADPKANLGSVLRTGGAGTVFPAGEKVDRSGVGLFWQGMQCFGDKKYPVRYHIEQRVFWDQFASGFGNAGTSTFLVLRGGHGGNDFQLRSELYSDFRGKGGVPIGMYTPTLRMHFGACTDGGAGAAASGGFRLGFEYASQAPIAVLLGDVEKEKDKGKSVVDKVIEKLTKDFKFDKILPLLRDAVTPLLRLLMFDQEHEAKLMCAAAIGIGLKLAFATKREWAQATSGRKRTLNVVDRAETYSEDWKKSADIRRREAILREQTPSQSKEASDKLEEQVKQLWAASEFNEGVRKEITEIAQLNRAFMRAAIKEATSPEKGLEEKFDAWVTGTDDTAKLAAFEKWLGEQRQNFYLDSGSDSLRKLKDYYWGGDFENAWEIVKQAVQRIDPTTGEYADDICETILAIASLIDIFHRMAMAIGKIDGLEKKLVDDLDKKRKAKEKEKADPDRRLPTILGKMADQAHDDKWAQDVLADAPSWGKQSTGLADGLSLVWSIDGGIGLGAGAATAGAGLGAFAIAGLSVTPPSFKLPEELMKKLSSKLMLIRFFTKLIGVLCEVIDYQIDRGHRPVPSDAGELMVEVTAWFVQAIHQTLREVLCPGALGESPKTGHEADPLEDWLFGFLSGTTISVGAKIEGLAKAVGTVLAAEARGSMGAELSVTLASLLDPLIEAIQEKAVRNPGEKLALGKRIIPKFSVKVKQCISAGASLGPAQLDVGITGQSLSADLLFPDGSPWRHKLEEWITAKVDEAVNVVDQRDTVKWARRQEGGFLHGLGALCSAVERIMKTELIPSVMDYEKKTKISDKPEEEGPGKATALVTNPSIQRMFDAIRDPVGTAQKRDKKKRQIDDIIEIIRKDQLHFGLYPDQMVPGLRTASAPVSSFDVFLLLPDAEVGQFSPKSKTLLHNVTYRIPLKDQAPAHAAQNTYRQKSDPKAKPINGIVVGFAKKADAEAFAKKRDPAWVDSSVVSVPPWPSPRSGESGQAQWYHWLNTKIFPAVEEARGKSERIDQPTVAVDAEGVLLTFSLAARGLLDKAPFSSFGMVKVKEGLLTEAKVLEGVWEDDIAQLRSEIAESIARQKTGAKAPAAASGAGASPPAPAGSAGPAVSVPAAPSVPSVPGGPSVSIPPLPSVSLPTPAAPSAAAPAMVRYSVKRAQVSVNHRLRDGGIPGWTKPLSTDGCFGPKTGAALDAWAKSVGAPPVQAEKGSQVVEVGVALARALDDDHDSSIVACAPPHPIPEDDAPWLGVARGELGQKEIKGAEDNPRIREYHAATTMGAKPDEVAWCSSFVNWCLAKANIRGTRSAAAASWVNWGVDTDPRRGAIVVIYNAAAKNSALSHTGNHVGFLVEDLGWGWKLLGGNQSDMVKESCFSKKKWALKAVKWPS